MTDTNEVVEQESTQDSGGQVDPLVMHFNNLTPAEAERLALLLEELGEVQQIIGKILRHGYESVHPDGGQDNRGLLETELGDVSQAMALMMTTNDISEIRVNKHMFAKANRVKKYLHHQDA